MDCVLLINAPHSRVFIVTDFVFYVSIRIADSFNHIKKEKGWLRRWAIGPLLRELCSCQNQCKSRENKNGELRKS